MGGSGGGTVVPGLLPAPGPMGGVRSGAGVGGELRLLPTPGPMGDHEPNRSSSRSAKTDRSNGERGVLIVFLVQ